MEIVIGINVYGYGFDLIEIFVLFHWSFGKTRFVLACYGYIRMYCLQYYYKIKDVGLACKEWHLLNMDSNKTIIVILKLIHLCPF